MAAVVAPVPLVSRYVADANLPWMRMLDLKDTMIIL